jgi:hypothetical protein
MEFRSPNIHRPRRAAPRIRATMSLSSTCRNSLPAPVSVLRLAQQPPAHLRLFSRGAIGNEVAVGLAGFSAGLQMTEPWVRQTWSYRGSQARFAFTFDVGRDFEP